MRRTGQDKQIPGDLVVRVNFRTVLGFWLVEAPPTPDEGGFPPPQWRAICSRLVLRAVVLGTMAALCLNSFALAQSADDAGRELFVFQPDTPKRLVRAAVLAEGADRPELARRYLRTLLDQPLSPEQLLALREAFGAGEFLKLNGTEALQPEAGELLTKINEASKLAIPTAADLDTLVRDLAGSRDDVVRSSIKLVSAGDRAVPALLSVDPQTSSGQVADALLTRYARQFRYGLMKALAGSDEATQVRILNYLRETGDAQLALLLLRYQFAAESVAVRSAATAAVHQLSSEPSPASGAEAAALLTAAAEDLLTTAGMRFPDQADVDRDERLTTVLGDASADDASADDGYGANLVRLAAKLSADAAILQPASAAATSTQLAAQAALDSWPAQWPAEVSLADAASGDALGSESVEVQALETALRTQNAAAILGLLNRKDIQSTLLQNRGDLLGESMTSGDPRVRLLAAGLLKHAGRSYARTSGWDETLRSVANGSTQPEAVGIDSRRNDAQAIGTVLDDSGFAARGATSGQQGFELAASQLNPSLILIHSNVGRWTLSPTVANLRADARTRLAPIVVYGPRRVQPRVNALQMAYPGVWFLDEPVSSETLPLSLQSQQVASPLLTESERQAMKEFAARLIAAE